MRAFGRGNRDKTSRNGPDQAMGTGKGSRVEAMDQARQGSKRLKPEKWKSSFDTDGKVIGFSKALKLIQSGGIDSSIRCEVWEFLLGCYGVGTTRDHRAETRMARRKRYKELIEKCRTMHASIGTGNLAYTVGSKIMDARNGASSQAAGALQQVGVDSTTFSLDEKCARKVFEDPVSPVDQPSLIELSTLPSPRGLPLKTLLREAETYKASSESSYSPGRIGPNSPNVLHFKFFHPSPAVEAGRSRSSARKIWTSRDKHENFGRVKKAMDTRRGVAEMPPPPEPVPADERTAVWLWTLHRIVVDVVRTDRHLKFYEDSRNLARLSDILAVYAWIDPETGYCQGMSDLLSPFVILFEDDADAFWCFESLLKRVRENFQMEGPVGVMRQLEALPKILELTDARLFHHLTLIGAEGFVFAFRMLLLHFRRELSFEETLSMWEMMWATDFDRAMLWSFENEPLESLQIKLPSRSLLERIQEDDYIDHHWRKASPCTSPLPDLDDPFPQNRSLNKITYESKSPLCGLVTSWPNFGRHRVRSGLSFGKNGDSEISVFVVLAIVITNREKFLREAQSMDDVIKMFNDIQLKIQVRSCIQAAIKMRAKYHRQLKRQTTKAKKKKIHILNCVTTRRNENDQIIYN